MSYEIKQTTPANPGWYRRESCRDDNGNIVEYAFYPIFLWAVVKYEEQEDYVIVGVSIEEQEIIVGSFGENRYDPTKYVRKKTFHPAAIDYGEYISVPKNLEDEEVEHP